MKKVTSLKLLSGLAVLEGVSYLFFALTMPLKYFLGLKGPNLIVGMVHGILFVAYCVLVIIVAAQNKWTLKTTFTCLLASLLPIATFVVDVRIIRPELEKLE